MIIQLLAEKGFTEGVDYSYIDGVLTALQKTRMVTQIIEHPAVEEILDEEGNVITPAVEAYTEEIQVEETYMEDIPDLQSLKLEAVQKSDLSLLISEYLIGKDVLENDSLNVDLFLNGGDGWRFENVPAPTIDQLYDLIVPTTEKYARAAELKRKRELGRLDRQKCEAALDVIAGYNRERTLTIEQITEMQTTFAQAESLLKANRPDFARQVISSIVADGVLVTQEMKDDVLSLLQ